MKKARNKFISRKFLISLICISFLALFAFLISDGYFSLDRDITIHAADARSMIDQRMTSLLFEMNLFPQYTGNDLLFLSRLSSLKKVIVSGETEDLRVLEDDFLEFLKQSTAYYQLGYIDENGDEIVRVEFDDDIYRTIPKESLQNKKEIDYFAKTLNLNEGEIFISQLDLKMENGKSNNLGANKQIYVPIMKSAAPVFSENKTKKGVVFLSFYANYFLDDIRRFQRQGEEIFLIDKEGNYLAHPDRKKEFAFMFERDENFYNDYPEISKEILQDFNKRRFESDNLIFTFRYLYPTAGDFRIHKGSENFLGENPEEHYFWVLMSVTDKNEIDNMPNKLKKDYLYFLLFSGTVILIILVLVFILVFRISNIKVFKRRRK